MLPSDGSGIVRRLVAEISADTRALLARSEEVRRFSAAPVSPERASAVALALDRTYTSLETLLERIARTLEGGAPTGEDWHRTLLDNAALDIEAVRPAVLKPPALSAADELRRFRHFLRHAYAVEIEAARVATLATSWLATLPEVLADLERFQHFLRQLAVRLDVGNDGAE